MHMRSLFDVLCIGDCMLDVFLLLEEASVHCRLDTDVCELSLRYGEKIPVDTITKIPGAGNASNAAVGLSRLGHRVGIMSTIGNDSTGMEILQHWREERISTRFVHRYPNLPTNYSTILHYKNERTILVHHEPYTYSFPKNLPVPKWIYYSSMGKQHAPFEKQLLAFLKKHKNIGVTYNPGTHQLRRGMKAIAPCIARSTIFIVNKEEAQRLLERDLEDCAVLLADLARFGAKYTVLTDGPKGAYATDGTATWFCGTSPSKELERTGAGDAFALTLTHALMQGESLETALPLAAAQSASVLEHVGPQDGLLSATALQARARRARVRATSL